MKKLMLMIAFAAISFAVTAQTSKTDDTKKGEPKVEQVAMKDHVCTDACSTSGKCVFMHGEKGHTCGDECKKMKSSDSKAKGHSCSAECTKGCCHIKEKHDYKHGEKGHKCGESCKK